MYSYNYNVPYNMNNIQDGDERFGAVPFLLGGVAGYALSNTGFGNNNQNNTNGIIYPIYPSYYYPYFPSYNNSYPYNYSNNTSNNYYY